MCYATKLTKKKVCKYSFRVISYAWIRHKIETECHWGVKLEHGIDEKKILFYMLLSKISTNWFTPLWTLEWTKGSYYAIQKKEDKSWSPPNTTLETSSYVYWIILYFCWAWDNFLPSSFLMIAVGVGRVLSRGCDSRKVQFGSNSPFGHFPHSGQFSVCVGPVLPNGGLLLFSSSGN